MGKTEGLLDLLKSLIEKYGEVLLKKGKRVWLAVLLAVSSGIFVLNPQWIVGKNILEVSFILIFVVCMVALAMWLIEFLYVNLKKRKDLNKQIIQGQQIVQNMIESFSLDELEFLMQFDERSKRTTVWYGNEQYDKFLNLNVVEPVSDVGEQGICIKLIGEYEQKWDRLKERFGEEIKERIKNFSEGMLEYLVNFEGDEEQEVSNEYHQIKRVMDIFEGSRWIRLKDLYTRCVEDARNEMYSREEQDRRQEEFERILEEEREEFNDFEYRQELERE